jgi:hypothetical protein
MSDFLLKKWYVDAADDRGHVYIGYWVSLHWQKLTLYGYQHLWRTEKAGIQNQAGLTQQTPPLWLGDHLDWQTEQVQARWDSVTDGMSETLLHTEQGEIKWLCLQPRAKATIHVPGASFRAWGYTECLEMTLPVWELPFKTLYWGRCHTDNQSVVWIKWGGSTEQNIVWYNNQRRNDLVMTDHLIRTADFQLLLGKNIPLREGKLISTIFKPFRDITHLFPKTTFLAEEHKWYNQGLLVMDHVSQPASTIYEEVLW